MLGTRRQKLAAPIIQYPDLVESSLTGKIRQFGIGVEVAEAGNWLWRGPRTAQFRCDRIRGEAPRGAQDAAAFS